MELTKRQQELLEGKEGETKAKILKTLVMYGNAFNADKMVDVSSEFGHLVTSFGISVMSPVYDLMDEILDSGVVSSQKFSVDPRPIDKNVPASFLQKLVFKFMYSKQEFYESQLEKMGLIDNDSFTCTSYLPEVGNVPKRGDILSWAESSAVVYANSVLGARCNRNSGIIEMFGSIVGCVPHFGLLTDEGRKASWKVIINTSKKPEAQVLGSAIGMKVIEEVPYIVGLDKFLGDELNEENKAYLKDMGAATASNGAVGLYHIENLTPEAKDFKEDLLKENFKTYIIDDKELERVKNSYPVIWKNENAKPKLCFVGCPHLTFDQLKNWTQKVSKNLNKNGLKKVSIPTVFTTSPAVKEKFEDSEFSKILKDTGIVLSYICPLMYMNNPLCGKMPVITNSNKLRTYTSSRYFTDDEILQKITEEGK